MTITLTELARWEAWMRAANRSEETIRLRTYHVRRVMTDLGIDPWSATPEDLVRFLSAKSTGWKPATLRSYRASLRAFYAWAQATGHRQDNPAALTPAVNVPRSLPRPLPETILTEALRAADVRVRLMLLLSSVCGLRRGELARLRREDVVEDLDETGARRHVLLVRGKGGKERMVPVPTSIAGPILRGPAGYVFTSEAWGMAGRPLTPAHIGRLVSAALPDGWTCHTLRHRCATVALEITKDLRAVQELLGHAKPETTAIYTLVRVNRIRAAVAATSSMTPTVDYDEVA
ncbi:tyrosine-type recombinase/integrase [Nocardioides fonticola]|uniref:Tyrosine-type recombinase/integrase n=2 Tax=Nocardioides fonticola TaxID=450363 RepID=A0ABP7XHJ1_9ACTN